MEESPVEGLVIKNCAFDNVSKGNKMENVKDPQITNFVVNKYSNSKG
jgi:hypothetical protein